MLRTTVVALTVSLLAVAPATAKSVDRNHDGLPDRWEQANHLSLQGQGGPARPGS